MNALEYLLSAYFHQDWAHDFSSTRDVVRAFSAREPREQREELRLDLRNLFTTGIDEETATELMQRAGCSYDPRADGLSVLGWLRDVYGWLSSDLATQSGVSGRGSL